MREDDLISGTPVKQESLGSEKSREGRDGTGDMTEGAGTRDACGHSLAQCRRSVGRPSPEGSRRGSRAGGADAEDPPGTSAVREAGVRVLLVLPSPFFLPGFP